MVHSYQKTPHRLFKNINYSMMKPGARKSGTMALFFLVAWLKSTSPLAAGVVGWAQDCDYPQVRPTCCASLGARWPHGRQAGPGLIKDVEPNWSCQHLLPLHLGGWRQGSAQYAHKRNDLEESHKLQIKKVNGMKGDQQKRFSQWPLRLTWNGPYTLGL